MKTVGGLRRTRFRGLERTSHAKYLSATDHNLVRPGCLDRVLSRQAAAA